MTMQLNIELILKCFQEISKAIDNLFKISDVKMNYIQLAEVKGDINKAMNNLNKHISVIQESLILKPKVIEVHEESVCPDKEEIDKLKRKYTKKSTKWKELEIP